MNNELSNRNRNPKTSNEKSNKTSHPGNCNATEDEKTPRAVEMNRKKKVIPTC